MTPEITGWAAAISTVGLLGPVLYWLCYHHLPAKDKLIVELVKDKDTYAQKLAEDIKELVRAKDEHIVVVTREYGAKLAELTTVFREQTKDTRADFKESLERIVAHCEKEVKEISETVYKAIREGRL